MVTAEQETLDKVWHGLKVVTGHRDLGQVDPETRRHVPSSSPFAPAKDICLAEIEVLRLELEVLQERLHAQATDSMLIILQGLDASGKDGTIRKVFDGVNPQGVTVQGYRAPTPEELGHDFLWRIHSKTPPKGSIAIFNRSHYEDMIVPLAYKSLDKRRLLEIRDEIESFERLLESNGTHIIRIFLDISFSEQAIRFLSRLEVEKKHWKFSETDLTTRSHWNDFQDAYSRVIQATSGEHRPWHVVPSDHKWYRDWAVMSLVVRKLREMDPQYPSKRIDDVERLIEGLKHDQGVDLPRAGSQGG